MFSEPPFSPDAPRELLPPWIGDDTAFICFIYFVWVGRRLRRRGRMTRAEVEAGYVAGNEPFGLRFEEFIDGAVVAELADANERLPHDDLPPTPAAGRHWFYGVEGGPNYLGRVAIHAE